MRPIPELLDADRQPRPMSKRIPSPYVNYGVKSEHGTTPPVVPRPKVRTPWLAIIAVLLIGACSLATFAVGALTILDWLRGVA